MHNLNKIEMLNLELTTNCPLRCPQCYCSLTGGKNLDLDVAISRVKEAKDMGLQEVMLSGGETMCYPHLFELIRSISDMGIKTNVALSGYRLSKATYEELLKAGIYGIFISLNGSTEEINSQTRDGYELAISALRILCEEGFTNTTLNWVMHSSNADDFENILKIAEKNKVAKVTVMAVKPTSKKELNTVPSKRQMIMVRDTIKNYKGKTRIMVETCFSPMLALISETKLFGNLNVGKYMGCGAGRWGISINVDGLFSPCRHLDYFENCKSVRDYWENSNILKHLREMNDDAYQTPCDTCRFVKHCRHCVAINSKIEEKLYRGNKYCPIAEEVAIGNNRE